MKSKITLLIALTLLAVSVTQASAAVLSATPAISIVSVVQNQSVTVGLSNFLPNDTLYVTMGLSGTQGIGGILVSKLTTGAGGSLTAKFLIPAELQGQSIISIRVESPTSGYYSFDWFYNNTAYVGEPYYYTYNYNYSYPYNYPYYYYYITPTPHVSHFLEGSWGFSISSVVKGESITVHLFNFPANETYGVSMGATNTHNQTYPYDVSRFNSASGGIFDATFGIPAALKYAPLISVKIWNVDPPHYFIYNAFYNANS